MVGTWEESRINGAPWGRLLKDSGHGRPHTDRRSQMATVVSVRMLKMSSVNM